VGYGIIFDPDPQRSKGQVSIFEFDTKTCAHCGRIIRLVHGDPSPLNIFEQNVKRVVFCTKCDAPVCTICKGLRCDPVEKKLDRWEKQERLSLR
jgi:hypothetical protein